MSTKIVMKFIPLFIGAFALSGCVLFTGKGILPGRSEGMANVTVGAASLEEVETAIHSVFIADRFLLKKSVGKQKMYERPGSRMKDLAYGGLASDGAWERAYLDIHDLGNETFRIECNVYIVSKNGDPFFDDQTTVLKLFGGQYRRLLNRVKLKLL